eukprot:TRINITY_DN7886_c0_g5_i2.p2 TRINITY_DN7886_c0_g5~~TRINITY_DN7886_c0_g5_i2.p2  ORF type:complete len:334 (-),score=96.59 TRINITY_DN7886_c0_g5_i2:1087-2088(-)
MEHEVTERELQIELALNELRLYLGEEKPPIDDKEFTITDNDIPNDPLDSSISDESSFESVPKEEIRKREAEDGLDLEFEDIDEVISKPYGEMPAFYCNQVEFEAIEGLPGTQKKQLEHKSKTILKNKYWEKILKSSYEMSVAKAPRPEHITKILQLYVINQEKLKAKRKEQLEMNLTEKKGKLPLTSPSKGNTRTTVFSPTSKCYSPRRAALAEGQTKRKKQKMDKLYRRSSASLTRSLSGIKNTPRQLLGLTSTHAASLEIQRRLDKLEKNNVKIDGEHLARDTENVLVRTLPYRKQEAENLSFAQIDTSYSKMLTKYLFSQGLVKKWKQSW